MAPEGVDRLNLWETGMARLDVIGALLLVSAIAGAASAQSATPVTSTEVVGHWTLRITPAERRGFGVTIKSDEGGRPDLPLTITAGTNHALTCIVGGDPAECEISEGELIVTSARSGGAGITFTLQDRTRRGFVGTALIRARLLPFGSVQIGSVNIVRR